mgnify:CR=1 FL=1
MLKTRRLKILAHSFPLKDARVFTALFHSHTPALSPERDPALHQHSSFPSLFLPWSLPTCGTGSVASTWCPAPTAASSRPPTSARPRPHPGLAVQPEVYKPRDTRSAFPATWRCTPTRCARTTSSLISMKCRTPIDRHSCGVLGAVAAVKPHHCESKAAGIMAQCCRRPHPLQRCLCDVIAV